jgi:hypothetical protein
MGTNSRALTQGTDHVYRKTIFYNRPSFLLLHFSSPYLMSSRSFFGGKKFLEKARFVLKRSCLAFFEDSARNESSEHGFGFREA